MSPSYDSATRRFRPGGNRLPGNHHKPVTEGAHLEVVREKNQGTHAMGQNPNWLAPSEHPNPN